MIEGEGVPSSPLCWANLLYRHRIHTCAQLLLNLSCGRRPIPPPHRDLIFDLRSIAPYRPINKFCLNVNIIQAPPMMQFLSCSSPCICIHLSSTCIPTQLTSKVGYMNTCGTNQVTEHQVYIVYFIVLSTCKHITAGQCSWACICNTAHHGHRWCFGFVHNFLPMHGSMHLNVVVFSQGLVVVSLL